MRPRRSIEEETSNSSLGEAVERYLGWQREVAKLTEKSLRPMGQSLRRWSAWMGPETATKELTLPDLEDYLVWLRAPHTFADGKERKTLSDQSIKTQFSMIRALFNWLLERDYGLHSSLFKAGKFAMKTPKVKEEIYDVYTADELTRLWEATDEIDRANRYRNKAIFAVLLGAGLRLGEVANLDDEDFDGEYLRIRDPKNKTPRFVPTTGIVQEAIRAYKSKRRAPERGAIEREPLFLGEEGARLTEVGITKVIQRLKAHADLGLQKKMVAGIHKFRHTYATYSVIRGRQLRGDDSGIWELSKRLGHKSIKITERYLTLTDPNLKVPAPWKDYIYVSSGANGRGA